jgi:CHAT domain-containing protein
MTGEDLLRQARLVLALGPAQRRVAAAATAPLAEQIGARIALCQAIEAILEHARDTAAPDQRGTVEMAVNEYGTLSDLHAAAGDHAAASRAFERGLAIAGAYGDPALIARMATDQAIYFRAAGRYATVLSILFTERNRLRRESPQPAEQIDSVYKVELTIAETLRWLGDFRRCEALLHEQRARLDATRDVADPLQKFFHDNRIMNLDAEEMYLALDSAQADEPARASSLDRAQAILERLHPRYAALAPWAGHAMSMQQCHISRLRGDPQGALALLDSLLPAFYAHEELARKRGTIRVLRARLLNETGRGAEAIADAEAGVAGESAYGQWETIWSAHWQLARARQAASLASQADATLSAFDDAVTALDRVRTASLGFRLDNLALLRTRPMLDEAVAAAVAHCDGARAARYADAVKSRYLTAALTSGAHAAPSPDDVKRLDALGVRIDALVSSYGEAAPQAAEIIAARAALIEEMRVRAGADAMAPSAALDIPQTLAVLQAAGQAAVQLFLSGPVLTAVLLKDGETRAHAVVLPPQVTKSLAQFERNVTRPAHEQFDRDYDPSEWQLSAETFLPEKVLSAALSARALLICPHGRLNLLPWPAMPCRGRRLFEFLPVGTLPNLACIVPLAARGVGGGRAALLGTPVPRSAAQALPITEVEIADLAALYGDRLIGAPSVGPKATLDAFRTLLKSPDAAGASLHIATHGIFLRDDPAGAALELTGRLLTAAEIALHPMPFAEVTLSACSTGVRPSRIDDVEMLGDDLVGLPASLLEAGAASVLTSITPTPPPASAALFTGYHRRRIGGMLPLEAFAMTQREMLAAGTEPLPGWIGFSLLAVR